MLFYYFWSQFKTYLQIQYIPSYQSNIFFIIIKLLFLLSVIFFETIYLETQYIIKFYYNNTIIRIKVFQLWGYKYKYPNFMTIVDISQVSIKPIISVFSDLNSDEKRPHLGHCLHLWAMSKIKHLLFWI